MFTLLNRLRLPFLRWRRISCKRKKSIPSKVLKNFPLLSEDSANLDMEQVIWHWHHSCKFENASRNHHQTGLRFVSQRKRVKAWSRLGWGREQWARSEKANVGWNPYFRLHGELDCLKTLESNSTWVQSKAGFNHSPPWVEWSLWKCLDRRGNRKQLKGERVLGLGFMCSLTAVDFPAKRCDGNSSKSWGYCSILNIIVRNISCLKWKFESNKLNECNMVISVVKMTPISRSRE